MINTCFLVQVGPDLRNSPLVTPLNVQKTQNVVVSHLELALHLKAGAEKSLQEKTSAVTVVLLETMAIAHRNNT